MDQRKLIWVLAGFLVLAAAALGWSLTNGRGGDNKTEEAPAQVASKTKGSDQAACASTSTYARLKEVAFEEAVRLRNADPANLDTLAEHSVVRMENPVVMSRDEDLNVTVCSGRFILELPPGAEGAFGGQRRLTADVEYAAQAAADGSGMVYELRGAEPIIRKLAAFTLQGRNGPVPVPASDDTRLAEAPDAPPPPETDPAAPAPPQLQPPVRSRPQPPAAPEPKAAPKAPRPAEARPARAEASARPSFNCRFARSRSEQMVCSDSRLAAKDRAMSSLFFSALADADPVRRRMLRRTRDNFLAYRERCSTESCVAQAYDGRMDEIRDIMTASD